VLEDTYNKYRQGYLEDSFMDSQKKLVIFIILMSPQMRDAYEGQKGVGIFPRPFIDWFDEELRNSDVADE
jgi:hypothetical protein